MKWIANFFHDVLFGAPNLIKTPAFMSVALGSILTLREE
jgi:hypothetical protein